MAFSWWSEDPITAFAAHFAVIVMCIYIGTQIVQRGLHWYDYCGWTVLFLLVLTLVVRANRK